MDRLIVTLHSVKMPVGFGGIKTKGRQLSVMAHLKRSIIEVKAEQKDGRWDIRPVVDGLLETTGIDLINGAGLPELTRFQEQFRDYKCTQG
jgi:hypothetical protein